MDWRCDECKKPESEVGSLIHGRLKNGHDYQLCKICRPLFDKNLIRITGLKKAIQMIPFEIKVIVKVPSEKSFVGLFGHHFHKWPTIRIVRSKLTTPRIGIVLFYKWNSYALVFAKKEVTDGQT